MNELICTHGTKQENFASVKLVFKSKTNETQELNCKIFKDKCTRQYTMNGKLVSKRGNIFLCAHTAVVRQYLDQIGLSMLNKRPSFIIHQNTITRISTMNGKEIADIICDVSDALC